MEEINLDSWKQFEEKIEELDEKQLNNQDGTSLPVSDYLYRGQKDSRWLLETTLDRFFDKEVSLKYYYRIISAAKPKVETFTGKKWNIKDVEEYSSWVNTLETPNYGEFLSYGYMAYLRHHGFPSPLLDWTASPYIAAFFAFNNIDRKTDSVSVFVYSERAFGIKLNDIGSTSIRCLGPYVEAHKRHFFQQSNYTICTIISDQDVYYAKHQTVFERNEKYQNLLWKINIPSTEQKTALRKLNRMNINAFSLFGNEDSLLETIAISDIFLKGNI